MQLPADIPTTNPPPSGLDLGNLTEAPPPVTSQQREADFNRVFVWHGQRLNFSVASDGYYRQLRCTMNAAPLSSIQTIGDFTSEAPRLLYCSSLTAEQIQGLYLLPPEDQIARYMAWVKDNVQFHELEAAAKLGTEINAAIARARTQPMETDAGEIDSMGN